MNYFPHLAKAKPVSVTQVCVCAFLNCALCEAGGVRNWAFTTEASKPIL